MNTEPPQSLLEAVRRRASNPATRTDQAANTRPDVSALLSTQSLRRVEAQLGFSLPEPLTTLCRTVGNGGFGPGYGLLGIDDGIGDDLGRTADVVYASCLERDPTDPAWSWPMGLLPICHWGCAIYSCVDTTDPDAGMVTWDPNVYDSTVGVASALRRGPKGLHDWLQAWADGVDLWDEMF